jgi:hypothetical protein
LNKSCGIPKKLDYQAIDYTASVDRKRLVGIAFENLKRNERPWLFWRIDARALALIGEPPRASPRGVVTITRHRRRL